METAASLPPVGRQRFITRGIRCTGCNGSIVFAQAMTPEFPFVVHEVKQWILAWEAGIAVNDNGIPLKNLHIGFLCKRGRHRSFGDMLLIANALRLLGYIVYTEAPDTTACGCPGDCAEIRGPIM